MIATMRLKKEDIAQWNLLQTDYRRKQRDTWTRYEVNSHGVFFLKNKLLTRLIAMTASQMRIAETIDAFYGDAGAKDGVSRSYKQAVEDLDAETIKALDGPYRFAPLPPMHLINQIRYANSTPLERPSSTLFLVSAHTSLISTNVSRNVTTNF